MLGSQFLSTPSARRATDGDISHYAVIEFLSTPSARRATSNNSFSIRFFLFLSTPSARRATIDQQAEIDSYLISIHALREEGDPFRHRSERVKEDFYPRPPRGGRHQTTLTAEMYRKFLSTPSARRATGQGKRV